MSSHPSSASPGSDVRLHVVVLNWNGTQDTHACLASLERQDLPDFHVLVIDNGSHDPTVGSVEELFPHIELVHNPTNLGYAEGNNVGIRRALEQGATHVLILNNDVQLADDCLSQLLRAAALRPDAGAVAPKCYFLNRPDVLYFAGGLRRGLTPQHMGLGEVDCGQYDGCRETEWITGCAILLMRQALEQTGEFDPRFFLLFEDVDWCMRAKQHGFALLFAPEAKIWHKVSASFTGDMSGKIPYYFTRNQLLLLAKHANGFIRMIGFVAALLRGGRAMRRSWWKSLVGQDSRAIRQRSRDVWQAIGDHCRRRYGPCRQFP